MDQIDLTYVENDFGLSNQSIEEENQRIEIHENYDRQDVEKSQTYFEEQMEGGNIINMFQEPSSKCYYTILNTIKKDYKLIIILLNQEQQPLYVEIHLIKQEKIPQCVAKFYTQIIHFPIIFEQRVDFLKSVFLLLAQLSVSFIWNNNSLSMNQSDFLVKQFFLFKGYLQLQGCKLFYQFSKEISIQKSLSLRKNLQQFWPNDYFLQYLDANQKYLEIYCIKLEKKHSFKIFKYINFMQVSFEQINVMMQLLQGEIKTQESMCIIHFLILHYQNSIFQNLMIQQEIQLEFFSQISDPKHHVKFYTDIIQSYNNNNQRFCQLLFYCFMNFQYNSFMFLNNNQKLEECFWGNFKNFLQCQYIQFCQNQKQNIKQVNSKQKVFEQFLTQSNKFNQFLESNNQEQFLIYKNFLASLINLIMVNIQKITETITPIFNYDHFRKHYIKIILKRCQQQHCPQFEEIFYQLKQQKKLKTFETINLKHEIKEIRDKLERITKIFPLINQFKDVMFYFFQPQNGFFSYQDLDKQIQKSIKLIQDNLSNINYNQNEARGIIKFFEELKTKIDEKYKKGRKQQYNFNQSDLQFFQKHDSLKKFIVDQIDKLIEVIICLEKDEIVKGKCINLLRKIKNDGN